MKEVLEVPEKFRGSTRYSDIVSEFLNSGVKVAVLDEQEIADRFPGIRTYTVYQRIRNVIMSHKLPIVINKRGHEIYFTRSDME